MIETQTSEGEGMIVTVTLNPSLDEWIHLSDLKAGKLNRARGMIRYPGGKGINVSRVVHELNAPTLAYALAGGDDGHILRQLMSQLKIDCDFITVKGATRNNYKIQTEHPKQLTEINTAGPKVSRNAIQLLEYRLLHHSPKPSCVVLSGSLPPGVPIAVYSKWIKALNRKHIPVVLDTSGTALHKGLTAQPWLIKPNHPETEELLKKRIKNRKEMLKAIRQLLERGPQIVILSLGKEGALMASKLHAGVWFARAPKVRTDSPVGCGDSLVGGFLTAWTRNRNLVEAFRMGVASGSATALTAGTELCYKKDVFRLLKKVKIQRLAV